MKYLYHSSTSQGLKRIEPQVSTHGVAWVYTMEKPEYCLMFLGNHSDIIIQTGFTNGVPYIAERFDGALTYAYKGTSGSIYTLSGLSFKGGMTSFTREFVCGHACKVLQEERIPDALEAIQELEKEKNIIIYRFPDLPQWLPRDKSDLIERAAAWAQRPGSTVLETVRRFHPDILEQVLKNL